MTEQKDAYKEAGVDINVAENTMKLIKPLLKSTYTKQVVSGIGGFGGLFDVSELKSYHHPILISSIDGVGTKTKIAKEMNLWTVGQDIVNHSINDVLAMGGKPLQFMDYLAFSKLDKQAVVKIIENMAYACVNAGIPLIAGETAEMPGVYQEGENDIVGALIGVVEKAHIIDGSKISAGDILIGLRSSGLHTNGYSLARKVLPKECNYELLKVHKCYLHALMELIENQALHGIAHITGGGFTNIDRLLPQGLYAEISQSWKIPQIFKSIQELGNVSIEEMRRVFNLGIGMVLVVRPNTYSYVVQRLALKGEGDFLRLGTIKKATSDEENQKTIFTF